MFWKKSIVHLFIYGWSFHFTTTSMDAFSSMEIHRSHSKLRVKKGCILAPTHIAIYFDVLLQHTFEVSEDRVYLQTRFDGSFFNLKRLKSKRPTTAMLTRKLLFDDYVVIAAHSEIDLQ